MKTLNFLSILFFLFTGTIHLSFSQKLTLRLGSDPATVEHDADPILTGYKGNPRSFDKIPNIDELKKIEIDPKLIISAIPNPSFKIKTNLSDNIQDLLLNDGKLSFSNLGSNVNYVEFIVNNGSGTLQNNIFKFSINSSSKPVNNTKSAPKDFTPFPFPIFSNSFDQTTFNKHHRILIIDGTSRNNLNRGFSLKKGDKKDSTNLLLKDVNALVTGKSLSVFTKNIGLRNLDYIRVSVNGSDYTFNAGVSNLLELASALDPEEELKNLEGLTSEEIKTENEKQNRIAQEYFSSIQNHLNDINELSIEDFQTLQQYQSLLLDSIKGIRLDPTSIVMVSKIVSFTPKYINLTSFPLTIPNNDEVTISTEVKYKGIQPNSISSGTFKTTGALSVNVGSAIYLTGLKNNKVYTEPVIVSGQADELRAVIDEDDQLSVGVGINSEVTYRTGSIFRPAINIGFFVPFDEEITPFFALGPALSIIDSKVSLNFSYGFAFGKINSINERYRDTNLNNIPNFSELDLIQKVWSKSWYVGIGVGYNINSSDK
ncbi:hypothetical protein [Aquiflexum gelatinilyticum]|uniref:Uncharacterized protein n=1 Tax=Aquiflexum gelatinilyticum TaxID=2961943 RepID=A0A9X2P5H9_9BACT|nr:hypothetical protein [Aquiflexum gelatinilyticum]MCR9015226.1 hypothetical protein [Aquiflexum gelatinilyticum]